ncbi:MAG: phosphotransferase [Chloroflexi bacterium]|nr:phosphotransferase [Chloroflexota bacterium]
MDESVKFEKLVQKILPGSKLLQTWSLAGGLSAQMDAVEIETLDGEKQKWIVRRVGKRPLPATPHPLEIQFNLLQKIYSTNLTTPKPILYDPSGTIFTTPILVMAFIEGEMTFTHSDLHDAMVQFGTTLAKIHAVDCTTPDLSFLPRRVAGCTELGKTQTAQPNRAMNEALIWEALQAVGTLRQQNGAGLLHGDYWPGNTLWHNDKLVAVIDWEDATTGDPLIDLAISRLDLVWIFGIDAMQTFTQQYQSLMDIDYKNLAYWDLCAALRLIRMAGFNLAEWVAFFPSFGRDDITEQSLLQNYHYFISQALAKL